MFAVLWVIPAAVRGIVAACDTAGIAGDGVHLDCGEHGGLCGWDEFEGVGAKTEAVEGTYDLALSVGGNGAEVSSLMRAAVTLGDGVGVVFFEVL